MQILLDVWQGQTFSCFSVSWFNLLKKFCDRIVFVVCLLVALS